LKWINGVRYRGGSISNCKYQGAMIHGAANNIISGTSFYNNMQGGSGQAVQIQSLSSITADYNLISGNKFFDSQATPTQTYGIYVADSTGNMLVSNQVRPEVTTPYADTGTGTVNKGNSWPEAAQTSLAISGSKTGYIATIENNATSGGGHALYLTVDDPSGNIINSYGPGGWAFTVGASGTVSSAGNFYSTASNGTAGIATYPFSDGLFGVPTKYFHFNTSGLTAVRTITVPDANSVTVQPIASPGSDSKWCQYIDSNGICQRTQPTVGDVTGALSAGTAANTYRSADDDSEWPCAVWQRDGDGQRCRGCACAHIDCGVWLLGRTRRSSAERQYGRDHERKQRGTRVPAVSTDSSHHLQGHLRNSNRPIRFDQRQLHLQRRWKYAFGQHRGIRID
jgi:hypothetical protein